MNRLFFRTLADILDAGGSADLLAVTWFLSGFPAGELFLH